MTREEEVYAATIGLFGSDTDPLPPGIQEDVDAERALALAARHSAVMTFTARLIVRIDPQVWEAAGYDPIGEASPEEAVAMVGAWLSTSQYLGSDEVPTVASGVARLDGSYQI